MATNIVSSKVYCPECEKNAHAASQKDCPECLKYAHQGTHKSYEKDCSDCQKYAQMDPTVGVIPDGHKDQHKKVFPDTHHGSHDATVIHDTHHEKIVDKHGKHTTVDDTRNDKVLDKHDSHGKALDSHHDKVKDKHLDNHKDKVNKDKHNDTFKETPDTTHGVKPDKHADSRKVMPTPHDNKEVPGRHHEKVHPEHYDTKKAHPDLKHEIHTDSHKHKVAYEAPRDVANETHADAHHTTYKEQTTGTTIDGLSSVRQDHAVIKSNMEQLLAMDAFSGHDRDAKQRLLNDTIALISQHNVASEVVLYRAIKKIDKSKARVAKNQTIEVEKLLYDIDQDYGTQVDKPHFFDRFKALDTLLMKHLADDDREIITVLETQYTLDNLESLNIWFDKVKKLAPTRPHPDGPHSAAAKIATGPAVAFVDQMRDGTKKFTK